MIHGGTPDEERVERKNRFEKPREESDSLDLLLFSEIGCEGLDYQFCDCIVNYDLPWNPMRVEQRIGRIDRNGQKSESVAIIMSLTSYRAAPSRVMSSDRHPRRADIGQAHPPVHPRLRPVQDPEKPSRSVPLQGLKGALLT